MPEYAEYLGAGLTLKLFYFFSIGLEYAVYAGLLLAWGGCLWLLGKSLPRPAEGRESRRKTAFFFAVFSAAAFCLAAAVPVRSGYDNNHDFISLGNRFFDLNLAPLLSFKEISPLFTDAVSDLLTGRSLAGLLNKNRLLLCASALVLYGTLRRFGFGKPVAGLACVFFGFNFLALLNAGSFATTMANVFIVLVSVFAAAEVHATARVGARELFWVFSSLVLVLCARYEFLPAVVLLSGAVLARAAWRGTLEFSVFNLGLSAVSLSILGLCAFHISSVATPVYLAGTPGPFANLKHYLWTGNLGLIAGVQPFAAKLSACAAALLAAAGWALNREKLGRNSAALLLLSLWAVYFSFIYGPRDQYPLHFMRHQLYFFLPFVYLFALGLDGAADVLRFFKFNRALKYGFAALGASLYIYLNARAAFSLNGEHRTNDIELEFLMKSQSEWKKDCRVVYPEKDDRRRLLEKYFPFDREDGRGSGACRLNYISPAPAVFKEGGPALPKAVNRPAAWRSVSFEHSFYTVWEERETREPVPVTIGFYPLAAAGKP